MDIPIELNYYTSRASGLFVFFSSAGEIRAGEKIRIFWRVSLHSDNIFNLYELWRQVCSFCINCFCVIKSGVLTVYLVFPKPCFWARFHRFRAKVANWGCDRSAWHNSLEEHNKIFSWDFQCMHDFCSPLIKKSLLQITRKKKLDWFDSFEVFLSVFPLLNQSKTKLV